MEVTWERRGPCGIGEADFGGREYGAVARSRRSSAETLRGADALPGGPSARGDRAGELRAPCGTRRDGTGAVSAVRHGTGHNDGPSGAVLREAQGIFRYVLPGGYLDLTST